MTRQALVALLAGLVFGAGLVTSQMVNPDVVLGFLDVSGAWNPSLAFVMGGALLLTTPAFFLLKKRASPLFAEQFHWPTAVGIDGRLLAGAVLFGIGWGMSGLCPAPALVGLVTGEPDLILFVGTMLLGMKLRQLLAD